MGLAATGTAPTKCGPDVKRFSLETQGRFWQDAWCDAWAMVTDVGKTKSVVDVLCSVAGGPGTKRSSSRRVMGASRAVREDCPRLLNRWGRKGAPTSQRTFHS